MMSLPFSLSVVNRALRFSGQIVAWITLFGVVSLEAGDWPQFRGPNQDGISTETNFRTQGKAPLLWQKSIGLGYSAPVVADGKVVISGHDGESTDTLWCFDAASGDEVWKHSYPQPLGDLYFQGGTTGCAAISGDRVYHLAREGEFFCLDLATGRIIWSVHLQKDHRYSKPTWGFSGAPLIDGDVVYLNAGEAGLALSVADGSVVWKSDNEEAGYSTPYLFERGGKRYLIVSNKRAYVCVDPATGSEVWSHRWMTRYGVNSADPIVSGDEIFISSGYGKGGVLLGWDGAGKPDRIWQNREMRTQMNAAILHQGHLYGIDGNESVDGTALKCLDWATGETIWSEESVGHGTVMMAGNHLIVLTEKGELQIAVANPRSYEPTLRQKLIGARIWTVPVLANGILYARNEHGQFAAVDLGEDAR
ncbi:MAG: PQQ-binding-like beta-propeller repeat protein [Verrucomicrobiota bacterium]